MSTFPSPRPVRARGVDFGVRDAGDGPTLLLLHGWPHTSAIWAPVWDPLAADHRVIALDSRGLGSSGRGDGSFGAAPAALDAIAVLDALDVDVASVVAIDAGVPGALLAAATRPDRIASAVLMESLLPGLPGAEEFLAAGPPWWFGFHAVPGFAEHVVEAASDDYVSFFLDLGLRHPERLSDGVRAEILSAYSGREALGAGFEFYRHGREDAAALAAALAAGPVKTPVLAIGGGTVGPALGRQLAPVTERLSTVQLEDCGHIVPVDQPERLVAALREHLARVE